MAERHDSHMWNLTQPSRPLGGHGDSYNVTLAYQVSFFCYSLVNQRCEDKPVDLHYHPLGVRLSMLIPILPYEVLCFVP